MKNFIPVNEPLLDGNEKQYLTECIDSGWISSEGPFVEQFEALMAKLAKKRYGIAVCNGSAALEAAVAALNIGPGDEVIMPAFTIISCANAIIRAGAKPILVDSDPLTWNMAIDQVATKITSATKAIMAVHIYGFPTDMQPLMTLCKKHGLALIEDAAEAIGQAYKGTPCGNFGDLSVFSFYPNKHVTTGEGGMILTDDKQLAEKCRSLRNLCFNNEKRFVHEEMGWNMRMTNMQAALGVAQVERLKSTIIKKRGIGSFYNQYLKDGKGIQRPLIKNDYADNLFWVYGLVLEDEMPLSPHDISNIMHKKGIGTRPFFWPMHKQPVFNKMGLFLHDHHPVAVKLGQRGFYLPSGLTLTEDQIEYISNTLKEILHNHI
ncbi:MAG: DegT/DnrJ/EryC1/StrS family aminotransferase [Desulfamplus sp.]|nr:DegT/DnrJ/EryC1/StrS family aminotransferase [Desulfamplus sp.]